MEKPKVELGLEYERWLDLLERKSSGTMDSTWFLMEMDKLVMSMAEELKILREQCDKGNV